MYFVPPRFSRSTIVVIAFVLIFQSLTTASLTQAQGEQPVPSESSLAVPPPERPFQLPFASPPGPTTWLLAQPYGNTIMAYFQRNTTYGKSGGIHFGVDFAAPCGTEIVAIADGVVSAVDGPFGSPPHNLMIDHPQLGYASMYGHLLEMPQLISGQQVKQGQVIGLVGEMRGNCNGYPELHLEIRDLGYMRKYNPTTFINANWNNLAMMGSSSLSFMHDLAAPRRWQTFYDQPETQTGGPILNNFANTWPLDWSLRQ